MVNKELLRQVLQIIKDNPEHWDQEQWHCDTTHCFAGVTEALVRGIPLDSNANEFTWNMDKSLSEQLSECLTKEELTQFSLRLEATDLNVPLEEYLNFTMPGEYTPDIAQIALRLSNEQADNLFDCNNTLEVLEEIVEALCNE